MPSSTSYPAPKSAPGDLASQDDDQEGAKPGLEREQDALFPELADPRPAPEVSSPLGASQPARRGPGRPEGSRNKRTADLVAYLQRLGYRDPLVLLHEVFSRGHRELAAEIGCKPLEAFQEQMKAIGRALPYWHQEMPKAVELKGDAPLMQMIVNLTADEAAAQGLDPADLPVIEELGQELESEDENPSNSGDVDDPGGDTSNAPTSNAGTK